MTLRLIAMKLSGFGDLPGVDTPTKGWGSGGVGDRKSILGHSGASDLRSN